MARSGGSKPGGSKAGSKFGGKASPRAAHTTPRAAKPAGQRHEPRRTAAPEHRGETPRPSPAENILYGRNPVREALKSGRSIERMLVAEGLREETTVRVLVAMAVERGIQVQTLPRARLDALCAQGHHQGVALYVAMRDYQSVDSMLQAAQQRGQAPLLLALDGVEDPHNLGALLRVCECVGAHGVLLPKNRSVGLTPAVERTASGAAEYLPVAQVVNLPRALEELKAQGLWVFGATMGGQTAYDCDLTGPAVIVLGGEGRGLTPLVQRTCDRLISLPMLGKINSLNAATAGAAVLYEVLRQRLDAQNNGD